MDCIVLFMVAGQVTQQELCNVTFKDKPSMTRLIDNLEKQQACRPFSGRERPAYQFDSSYR